MSYFLGYVRYTRRVVYTVQSKIYIHYHIVGAVPIYIVRYTTTLASPTLPQEDQKSQMLVFGETQAALSSSLPVSIIFLLIDRRGSATQAALSSLLPVSIIFLLIDRRGGARRTARRPASGRRAAAAAAAGPRASAQRPLQHAKWAVQVSCKVG
jgi:hypothetical protein